MIQDSAQVDLGGGSVNIGGDSTPSMGRNTIRGNTPYDVIKKTAATVKAENIYWDHAAAVDVLQYDVSGSVDVNPLAP